MLPKKEASFTSISFSEKKRSSKIKNENIWNTKKQQKLFEMNLLPSGLDIYIYIFKGSQRRKTNEASLLKVEAKKGA